MSSSAFAQWSMVERGIRKKIPKYFMEHEGGPTNKPAQEDISNALKLADISKEDRDILDYAFMYKWEKNGLFKHQFVYLTVKTPLFLIAQHARERSREYKEPDPDFIFYSKNIELAKLEIQFQEPASQGRFPYYPPIILLRDGVRVEPMTTLQSLDGKDPFKLPLNTVSSNILANTTQIAAQYSQGFWASMNEEQKKQAIVSWRAMGLGDDQILAYSGITEEELQKLEGREKNEDGSLATVTLMETSNIYKIEELNKPGTYEIVFRTPSMVKGEGKEIKLPISFDGFR
jgi:hypothetical protein